MLDTDPVIATLPAMVRPHLKGQLPAWLQVRWLSGKDQALALAGAEIGWFDTFDTPAMAAAMTAARDMRWLN